MLDQKKYEATMLDFDASLNFIHMSRCRLDTLNVIIGQALVKVPQKSLHATVGQTDHLLLGAYRSG